MAQDYLQLKQKSPRLESRCSQGFIWKKLCIQAKCARIHGKDSVEPSWGWGRVTWVYHGPLQNATFWELPAIHFHHKFHPPQTKWLPVKWPKKSASTLIPKKKVRSHLMTSFHTSPPPNGTKKYHLSPRLWSLDKSWSPPSWRPKMLAWRPDTFHHRQVARKPQEKREWCILQPLEN